MEAIPGVNLLNKVFHPVKCSDIKDALNKLKWTDSAYIDYNTYNTYNFNNKGEYSITNHCDMIYDIEPATQICINTHASDGTIKRRIRLPTSQFTAQNPLVRCACSLISIETEIPVKYKAMFINDSIRKKVCETPFTIGNLLYIDGKIVETSVINPIL